nr:DNA polymerase alpha catalytic subunit [Ipomoea batatas]
MHLLSVVTRPRLGMLSHFTAVRKLERSIFPMGFTKEATYRNTKARELSIAQQVFVKMTIRRMEQQLQGM